MADVYKKIRGLINDLLQIGKNGVQLKNNAGVLEVRNSTDNGFGRVKVAAPQADAEVVNRKYLETYKGNMIISRQADTSVSIPINTAARGFVVITTPGTGAVIGDLLYDDGSAAGAMEIITAIENRTIAITDALVGGQITFDPDSIYTWNADATAWAKIGDIGSITGALRVIRYAITNAASQDSTSSIPANARIFSAWVEITTFYSAGGTIAIGNSGSTALLQTITDNNAQAAGIWEVEQDTDWGGSALPIRTTVGGTPAVGAGIVVVKYAAPNA